MTSITFALIHSPLTGPQVWWPVAANLRALNLDAIVPDLHDTEALSQPYWQQHVQSAVKAILASPAKELDQPTVLVAHSGAGPLLTSIGCRLTPPPAAYLFIDAGLPPRIPATRLDLMHAEDDLWAAEFEAYLISGGRYPAWTDSDLRESLPDPLVRQLIVNTLRPRGLTYFAETLEPTANRRQLPGAYLQWSRTYNVAAQTAATWGWPVRSAAASHFHLLIDPEHVTADLVDLTDQVLSPPA